MNSKIILIGIAIVAIGLIALPQTFALFAGQHNWYYLTGTPDDNYGIPCQKCHADVYSELALSQAQGGGAGVHNSQTCSTCHITALVDTEGGSVGGDPTTNNIHAAGLPYCLDCHSANASNTNNGPDARSILTGDLEAHKPFANQAALDNQSDGTALLKGANEACIACHTHVAVDINWQKAYKLGFNATEKADTGIHSWSVGNFVAEGTVSVSTYGNRNGSITGVGAEAIDVTGLTIPGYDANNP